MRSSTQRILSRERGRGGLEAPPSPWARFGSVGLLLVAILLAAGLALLGVANHRRVRSVARRAMEGQALEIGLGAAAALRAARPRGPELLLSAVMSLRGGPVRSASVVGMGGRVMASSEEDLRGRSLAGSAPLRRLRGSGAIHHVSLLSGGEKPVYEVWIALRHGRGRRGRGHRWGRWMRGRWRGGRFPGGPPPWSKAFLRLEVQVSEPAIAAATRDAGWTLAASLSAAVVLLMLALLLFVADRRARRLRQVSLRQRSLAEMGEMAAVLAHEIRTPLGVIKGHAQLLAERAEGTAAVRLATVVEQSGRLERLVNGLLDYARPGEPNLVEVEVQSLVEKSCELLAGEALERDVALVRDLEQVLVRADPDQLIQVVVNLLRNALQASSSGAAVTVKLRHRGDLVVLEVLDTGEGLPDDGNLDIFKPFVTTRPGGAGLGLAVSRRVAEAHGGSLRAERGAGGGARLVLTLPVLGPQQER